MKKTMKKALILMTVVIATMLIMTFAASAASDCGDGKHLTGTRVIEATCTSGGYTETYCTVCDTVFGTSDHVAALGHDYDNAEWNYVTNGNGFNYQAECARDNCSAVKNDGKFYHSVSFINPWATDTTTTKAEISYTVLAKTWKNEQVGLTYVEENGTVSEGVDASRQKDYDFGKYDLSGWTLAPVDSGEFTESDLFVFGADGTKVTENTTLYAAFTGDSEVYYSVQFYNANGTPLTRDIAVRHGQKVDDSIFRPDENGVYDNAPTLPETSKYYYTFDRWTIDINALYGNATIAAVYVNNPKMYEYIYYRYEGSELKEYATETVVYGEPSKYYGDPEFKKAMEREKDRTYVYAWLGDFVVVDGIHTTSISSMQAPVGYLDTRYKDSEDYEPIRLAPKHVTNLVEYSFNLTAVIPSTESDVNYYLDKIIIQVLNDKGQYVGGGRTSNVDGEAVFSCLLNDSQYYTITAVTEDGKYEAEKVLERTFIYDTTYTNISTTVYLELSEDYVKGNSCSCIHHNTLFRGLWVRILNLLYNLFNVKYVCCDDMYATLADVLAYTR
ncbi:MAG: hypothetical protein IJ491_06430 [Clostridia bacterium]|nr:hypothetical protein [Clostridia bacterium]